MLGVDRDSEVCAELFDESDAAVLWAIEQIIGRATRAGITSSLCGLAPSPTPRSPSSSSGSGSPRSRSIPTPSGPLGGSLASAERRIMLEHAGSGDAVDERRHQRRRASTTMRALRRRAWDSAVRPGDVNIADRAVVRHVREGHGDDGRCGGSRATTRRRPSGRHHLRDARTPERTVSPAALRRHGIEPGAGVATLAGRIPELYVAALGTLKARCVYSPLFSAFGPEPIAQRLALGQDRGAGHDAGALPPQGGADPRPAARPRTRADRRGRRGRRCPITGPTPADGDVVRPLHRRRPRHVRRRRHRAGRRRRSCTSRAAPPVRPKGARARPRGGRRPRRHRRGRSSTCDPDDVYWCTADPGWVTGTSYGIIAPLVNGATIDRRRGRVRRRPWYRILDDQRVDVFYTAPTAIRMLQRVGDGAAPTRSRPSGSSPASANRSTPSRSLWARRVFGVPVLDTWWQTETGAIMIANRLDDEVRPGRWAGRFPASRRRCSSATPDGDLVARPTGTCAR